MQVAGSKGCICYKYFFVHSLDRSQSKRDGGFKNNWSFDHAEESEGDTEKEYMESKTCKFKKDAMILQL
uniref:Uncharacterized protein n=2 Tax=Strigidae TaxID=30459 RepID=A0A8D0FNR0_STROC